MMKFPAILLLLLVRASHVDAFVSPGAGVSSSRNKHGMMTNIIRPLPPQTTNNKDESSFFSKPHFRSLQLSMMSATNNNDNNNNKSKGRPVVNLALVRQSVLNQVLIGWTIWIPGGLGAAVLKMDTVWNVGAVAMGVAGVLPLLAFSQTIEKSESRAFADLNLSTNMLLLRLFGDEPQPVVALVVSAFLSGLTGLVEEVTFRGQLVPQMAKWAVAHDLPTTTTTTVGGNNGVFAGAVISTLIFAALHVNPLGLFQGRQAAQDAIVLFLYQIITGGTFCALYLASGYNLAVPIITHFLYDLYTFYNTHLVVTGQMQYANQASLLPINTPEETKWRKNRGDDFVLDCKESFYLADTNRDGVLSREELRIALYSYGIRLSAEQSAKVAQYADVDQSGTIDFGEYLEFVGVNGSRRKAIKQSLLGVN